MGKSITVYIWHPGFEQIFLTLGLAQVWLMPKASMDTDSCQMWALQDL